MTAKYSVEELLRLRTHSKSEEIIRKISCEAEVKEHILVKTPGSTRHMPRGARNFPKTATMSGDGFEAPPNDDFYFHGKPRNRQQKFSTDSPTASIRGRKARAFLEQHGSPPGHRVTAGGRVVPDGVTPMRSPENYPFVPMLMPDSIPNGAIDHLEGYLVNVGSSNICQIINGRFVHVGMADGPLRLLMPPSNNSLSLNPLDHAQIMQAMQSKPNMGAAPNMPMQPHVMGGFNANPPPWSSAYHGFPYYGPGHGNNGYANNANVPSNMPYAVPNSANVPPHMPFTGPSNANPYQSMHYTGPINANPYQKMHYTGPSNANPYQNKFNVPENNTFYAGNSGKGGSAGDFAGNFRNNPSSSGPSRAVSTSHDTLPKVTNKDKDPLGNRIPSCEAIRLLEKVMLGCKNEIDQLNRNEVINMQAMSIPQAAEVVKKRVELTEKIAECRDSLEAARKLRFGDDPIDISGQFRASGNNGGRVSSQARPSSGAQSANVAAGSFNQDWKTPSFYARPASSTFEQQQQQAWAAGVPGVNPHQAPYALGQGHFSTTPGLAGYRGPHAPQTAPAPAPAPAPAVLKPKAKEFVPSFLQAQQAQKVSPQHLPQQSLTKPTETKVLTERRSNVGLGIEHGSQDVTGVTAGGSTGPSSTKPHESVAHSMGINLDGIGAHTRRSHAVEIKSPEVAASQNVNDKLNTSSTAGQTSVKQDPSQDDSPFVPSPRLVAEMHNLVTSPDNPPAQLAQSSGNSRQHARYEQQYYEQPRHEQMPPGSSNTSFNTGSSATTADFFPKDPQSHSLHKWSYSNTDHSVNLANWLPKEGDELVSVAHVTPVKSTNKFRFNDSDSPMDENYPPYGHRPFALHSGTQARSSPQIAAHDDGANQFVPPMTHNAKGTTSASTSFDSAPGSSHRKASDPPKRSPVRTIAYWDGFRIGLHQLVLTDNPDEQYRLGYRDGIVASSTSAALRGNSNQSPTNARKQLPLRSFGSRGQFTTTSDPSIRGLKAPTNSATNSPLRQSFADDDVLDQAMVSFPDPLLPAFAGETTTTRQQSLSFEQPASMNRARMPEPVSPLANRKTPSEKRTSLNAGTAPLSSGSRIFSGPRYAQQRYVSKGQASVAPSHSYAQGQIPQLDGSNDDDSNPHALEEASTNVASTESTVHDENGKQKVPSSPIKRASSAMRHLTSISGSKKDKSVAGEGATEMSASASKPKKEDDPVKMTGPEKTKWKGKWKRRFDELKKVEQAEIEANRIRNNNPY